MARIVVASHNPIKALAVDQAFHRMFPGQGAEILPVSVASGVSDQPDTSAETRRGALNRARAAREALPEADFWFGIEGGIEDSPAGMEAFAWIVALSRTRMGQGKTASFFLPGDVSDLVRGGLELGQADDIVFGRENSKQTDGAVGLLTGNVVDRRGLYEHGVIMALIPFKNEGLYPAEAGAEA
jgi:inosine/xanthosine triphosphatase